MCFTKVDAAICGGESAISKAPANPTISNAFPCTNAAFVIHHCQTVQEAGWAALTSANRLLASVRLHIDTYSQMLQHSSRRNGTSAFERPLEGGLAAARKIGNPARPRGAHRPRGFSLIELMIVVVIIAILAAITIPAYSDYVKRGRITDAVGKLAEMNVKMEQLFQDTRTYKGGCVPNSVAPSPTNTDFFTFSCPTLSDTQYQIVATGKSTMAGFVFTLSQDNTRQSTLPADWGGGSTTCWILSKGGSC